MHPQYQMTENDRQVRLLFGKDYAFFNNGVNLVLECVSPTEIAPARTEEPASV